MPVDYCFLVFDFYMAILSFSATRGHLVSLNREPVLKFFISILSLLNPELSNFVRNKFVLGPTKGL